jgi:hypothetical protein
MWSATADRVNINRGVSDQFFTSVS